jgi:methionyl-tRNA formyltransferase
VPIGPEETADQLRARLVEVGTDLLLQQLGDGLSPPVPQEGEPTYAAKIDPEELHLDWSQPAVQLHRVIRLGRAWTTFRGKRLRILAARLAEPARLETPPPGPGALHGLLVGTGDGALEVVEVQPEGRGPMAAADWVRGIRPAAGERLGP